VIGLQSTGLSAQSIRLIRAYIPLITGAGSVRLSGFVIGVIIARTLGTESVGVYAKIVTLAYMLQFVGDAGTNLWLVRRVGREPETAGSALGSVLLCKALLSGPMLLIIITSGWLLGYNGMALDLLPLGGIVVVVFIINETAFTFLQVSGRNMLQGIIQTAMGVMTMTAPLIWIGLGFTLTLPAILLFQLSAQILSLCWSALVILRTTRPTLDDNLFVVIRESQGFLWQHLALMIHTQLIIVIVGTVMSDADVGHFRVAQQLVAALFMFGAAAFYASNPSLQRASVRGMEGLLQLHRTLIRFLSCVGLPMSVALLILAPQVLRILYGASYVDAASVLRWMSFAVAFRLLTHTSNGVLMAAGDLRLWLGISSIPLILDIAAVWPLAIFFGGDGAAIGLCLTEGVLAIVVVSVTAYRVSNREVLPDIIVPLVAALIMGIILFLLQNLPIGVTIPIGAGSFLAVLIASRHLRPYLNPPAMSTKESTDI
jgi:O-antigen/teichoic acid export membrane protein